MEDPSKLKAAIEKSQGKQSPYEPDARALLYSMVEDALKKALPTVLPQAVEEAVKKHMGEHIEGLVQKGLRGEKGDAGINGFSPTVDHNAIAQQVVHLATARDDRKLRASIVAEVLAQIPEVDPDALARSAAALVRKPKDGKPGVGVAGRDGSPDNPEEIVAKIHTLKEPIRMEAVKGLGVFLRNLQNTLRDRKGSEGKMIHGGGATVKYGSAAPGIVAMVYDENLGAGVTGTVFTLAFTPIAGSVRVHRGGARITVANGDYTVSGKTITLASSKAAQETITADYAHS